MNLIYLKRIYYEKNLALVLLLASNINAMYKTNNNKDLEHDLEHLDVNDIKSIVNKYADVDNDSDSEELEENDNHKVAPGKSAKKNYKNIKNVARHNNNN